jgi:hypothetical protein
MYLPTSFAALKGPLHEVHDRRYVAWLTPHAAIARAVSMREWIQLPAAGRFDCNTDGKETVAWAFSPEHLLELCDVVIRVLVASAIHSVNLGS